MSIQDSVDATYMDRLSRLVHSKGQLESHGYTLAQLNAVQLDKKRRCAKCFLALHKHKYGSCQFHNGRVENKHWTCCGRYVKGSSPCQQRNCHEPRRYAANELSNLWKYHKTPEKGHNDTRDVVVIDCEMAADAELIKISLVDFVTGEMLINKLVWPDVKVTNWNTPHSGVTGKEMYKARKDKTCIFGRKKAREEIWEFVGPKTIVVGHATNNDLSALRWIHPRVIDTQIVESNAVDEPNGLSLKSLVLEHLGKTIQPRGKGHDCLEDAMATRDLLHCQVLRASKPQKAWVPVIQPEELLGW